MSNRKKVPDKASVSVWLKTSPPTSNGSLTAHLDDDDGTRHHGSLSAAAQRLEEVEASGLAFI